MPGSIFPPDGKPGSESRPEARTPLSDPENTDRESLGSSPAGRPSTAEPRVTGREALRLEEMRAGNFSPKKGPLSPQGHASEMPRRTGDHPQGHLGRPQFQAGLWLQSALSAAFSAPVAIPFSRVCSQQQSENFTVFQNVAALPSASPTDAPCCWPGTCFLQGQNSPQGSAQSVVPSGGGEGLLTPQERLPRRPRAATGSLLALSNCLRPGPGLPGRPRAILVTHSWGRFHNTQRAVKMARGVTGSHSARSRDRTERGAPAPPGRRCTTSAGPAPWASRRPESPGTAETPHALPPVSPADAAHADRSRPPARRPQARTPRAAPAPAPPSPRPRDWRGAPGELGDKGGGRPLSGRSLAPQEAALGPSGWVGAPPGAGSTRRVHVPRAGEDELGRPRALASAPAGSTGAGSRARGPRPPGTPDPPSLQGDACVAAAEARPAPGVG
eukprot:XP_028337765.1 basic salivary proline-rich protein 2-like [Physeter catodon]